MLEMKKIISIVLAIGVLMTAFSIAVSAEITSEKEITADKNVVFYVWKNVTDAAGSASVSIKEGSVKYAGSGQAMMKPFILWGSVSKYAKEGDVKYLKTVFTVVPKIELNDVRVSRANSSWGLDYNTQAVTISKLEKDVEYNIVNITDLSNGKAYVYVNGKGIGRTAGGTIEDTANSVDFIIPSVGAAAGDEILAVSDVRMFTYTDADTLKDLIAPYNTDKVGKVQSSVKPVGVDNGDGTYTVTITNNTSAMGWERRNIPFGESVYLDQSDEDIETSFVRLHTNIQYSKFDGGYTTVEPQGTSRHGEFGSIVISDGKVHSLDFLVDVNAKMTYVYIDGVLAAKNALSDTIADVNGMTLFTKMPWNSENIYTLSDVYKVLYYDYPTAFTLAEAQADITSSATVPVVITGGTVFCNNPSNGNVALAAGYAGYDEQSYSGYIVQYNKNGVLTSVSTLKASTNIDKDTDNVRMFIWSKNGVTPITESFTAKFCGNIPASAE